MSSTPTFIIQKVCSSLSLFRVKELLPVLYNESKLFTQEELVPYSIQVYIRVVTVK